MLDMGGPVKIVDLARSMIQLSGCELVRIKFTDLRAGERLYEEPLTDSDVTLPSRFANLRIAKLDDAERSRGTPDWLTPFTTDGDGRAEATTRRALRGLLKDEYPG